MFSRAAPAVSALALALAAPCFGQCIPVTALPLTIGQPGTYCLTRNLTYTGSGVAIAIRSSDVVLDLAGFAIQGSAGAGAATIGVLADRGSTGRTTTVRNGTVRGFRIGVSMQVPQGVVEDVGLVGNWYVGVAVAGADSVVRRCRVSTTGGSTRPADLIPIAIGAGGDRVVVEDNQVENTIPPPGGEAVGISVGDGDGARVERNVITNPTRWPNTWAIWLLAPATNAVLRDNVIIRYEVGIAFPTGTAGEYRGNLFLGVRRAIVSTSLLGKDGGGNRSGVACDPILSLPFTITSEGSYCLVRSMSTAMASGAAIRIDADFVVLDLMGFKLGGGSAGANTETTGVYAQNRRNITVRNGNVRGFLRGIFLGDTSGDFSASRGHVVQGIRADENTGAGIHVQGRDSQIRANQVVTTGGTAALGANADVFGILAEGPGARVLDNDVIDTVGVGSGVGLGIAVSQASGTVVERNRVGNSSGGASCGVRASSGDNVLVVGNRISTMAFGVVYETATGRFRDNLTSGVATPYSGGSDAGNNQ